MTIRNLFACAALSLSAAAAPVFGAPHLYAQETTAPASQPAPQPAAQPAPLPDVQPAQQPTQQSEQQVAPQTAPATQAQPAPQTEQAPQQQATPHAQPEPQHDVIDDLASNAKPGKAAAAKDGKDKAESDRMLRPSETPHPVLWHHPGNIAALDLYFGQGGPKHQPQAPFTFEAEDHNGTNPKFDVRDGAGRKWRVKLGEEPRPEVVSSRLLWAMGYFVQDDYLVTAAHVDGLKISRKSGNMHGEDITFARFARKPSGQAHIGDWRWADNPFLGTQEFDGLRVMMAVINNWDLKDDNNNVYQDDSSGQQLYLVKDIGASFGTNGLSFTRARSKGNIASFRGSKFITRNDGKTVDFGTPAAPTAHYLETFGTAVGDMVTRHNMEKIGQQIPIEHVRWMAGLLAQLTHKQIADAFRAGSFPEQDQAAYVSLVEERIAELKKL